MCAFHKYERMDKYKPLFNEKYKNKNIEIEISIEEICMSLDFFHNGCNQFSKTPKIKINL